VTLKVIGNIVTSVTSSLGYSQEPLPGDDVPFATDDGVTREPDIVTSRVSSQTRGDGGDDGDGFSRTPGGDYWEEEVP
jgi:hypothetical protein